MGLRSTLATYAIGSARAFGNALGCETAVEFSSHSIELKMVDPSTATYAWDPDLYVKGNAFYTGYANPIKPVVDKTATIKEPDEIDVEDGDPDESDASGDDRYVSLISSTRHVLAAQNNIISQLINPKERLKLIQWSLIAIAGVLVLTFLLLVVVAARVGVF